jgi:hypothetical protein
MPLPLTVGLSVLAAIVLVGIVGTLIDKIEEKVD